MAPHRNDCFQRIRRLRRKEPVALSRYRGRQNDIWGADDTSAWNVHDFLSYDVLQFQSATYGFFKLVVKAMWFQVSLVRESSIQQLSAIGCSSRFDFLERVPDRPHGQRSNVLSASSVCLDVCSGRVGSALTLKQRSDHHDFMRLECCREEGLCRRRPARRFRSLALSSDSSLFHERLFDARIVAQVAGQR